MADQTETVIAPPAAPVAETPAATALTGNTSVITAEEVAQLKADAEKWKTFSRKNEDKFKTTQQQLETQQALLKQLAEKAGISTEAASDPEKLTQQLAAAQQTANQRTVEMAILRTAAAQGANPDALLDSQSFLKKAGALDPSDPNLVDQVKALITEAVQGNTNFKLAQAAPLAQPQLPASSGGDFSGAPAQAYQWTDQDVARATPEELSAAISRGQLGSMGIGRGKQH